MRRNSFPSRFKALPVEKKIITIVSLGVLISCFLPWYGINSRVINEWWNAFGSIGSVAGYIVASFAILSLAMILLPTLKPNWNLLDKFPWKESSILFFLNGQSFLVILFFIPVYAQYSLINATSSGTRFGIYLALAGTLIATIMSLSYQRRALREDNKQAEFAKVPREHRDLSNWEQESDNTETEEELAQNEELEEEQESIFSELSEEDIRKVSSVSNEPENADSNHENKDYKSYNYKK